MNFNDVKDDADVQENVSLVPSKRKQEKITAWLFTLILHAGLVCVLISYWYFYQRPNIVKQPLIEAKLKSSLAKSTSTNNITASKPASAMTLNSNSLSVASVSTITSDLVVPVTFNAPAMYFFAPTDTISKTNIIAASTPPVRAATQKIITQEAPINQILTKRDIPHKEAINSYQKTPKDKLAADDKNKEVTRLAEDIDVDNTELTRLIDQVKTNNQQKIDADTAPTILLDNPSQ